MIVWFQKVPILPPWGGHWKFPGGGERVVFKATPLEEKYDTKLEFPVGL